MFLADGFHSDGNGISGGHNDTSSDRSLPGSEAYSLRFRGKIAAFQRARWAKLKAGKKAAEVVRILKVSGKTEHPKVSLAAANRPRISHSFNLLKVESALARL
jgi:hypothetical protein